LDWNIIFPRFSKDRKRSLGFAHTNAGALSLSDDYALGALKCSKWIIPTKSSSDIWASLGFDSCSQ